MKKKILVIPVFLLTCALISLPVMAAPATKIEGVTATIDFTETTEYHAVDHGIIQVEGISTGTVTLNIPGQVPLFGTLIREWIGTIKLSQHLPDPDATGLLRGHVVWTFVGEGTTGTFEGTRHTKFVGFPRPFISNIEIRYVLQGTGDFSGQTLKLAYEGPTPPVFEGTLLIPN